jgi:spore coat polysaccharide biosynthesis protein SpsF
MRVVAVLQARLSSTRLPGKVLIAIAGRPMLAHVAERVRACRRIEDVWLATSDDASDDPLVEAAHGLSLPVARGPLEDVLERYRLTAAAARAEAVVRITCDCPLLDPEVTDRLIERFLSDGADYASTSLPRNTWPRGLDSEVMTVAALERAAREAAEFYERVHVTPYLYCHPELFKLVGVQSEVDHSDERWTVDTAEDLAFVRAVAEHLAPGATSMRDVLAVLSAHPEIRQLNCHIRQKPLEAG